MKSIIDIGMDVHKKTFSLCAIDRETGEILGETKIPSDVNLVLKFIDSMKRKVGNLDA